MPLLANLASLGRHPEEQRLKGKKEKLYFIVSCVWDLQASPQHESPSCIADVDQLTSLKRLGQMFVLPLDLTQSSLSPTAI